MTRLLLMVGGILALVSLLFGWWFSFYGASTYHSPGEMISLLHNSSSLIYSISPVLEGTSPGVPINDTSFGIHYAQASFLIPVVIFLMLLAGFIAIISSEISQVPSLYEIIAAAMAIVAIALFISVLLYTSGPSLLAGSVHQYGLNGFWGLGPGLFVAVASVIIMIIGRKQTKANKTK